MKCLWCLLVLLGGCQLWNPEQSSTEYDGGVCSYWNEAIPESCIENSDCFVGQCAHAICDNGTCTYSAYEDGQLCIDVIEGAHYVGICDKCVCAAQD